MGETTGQGEQTGRPLSLETFYTTAAWAELAPVLAARPPAARKKDVEADFAAVEAHLKGLPAVRRRLVYQQINGLALSVMQALIRRGAPATLAEIEAMKREGQP
jgi:hypothetical protein